MLPTDRPREKAQVEAAVLIIERWILARLRHQRFYSLAELNAAIGELLKRLNDERPIRRSRPLCPLEQSSSIEYYQLSGHRSVAFQGRIARWQGVWLYVQFPR
jgi:hypothetical protein